MMPFAALAEVAEEMAGTPFAEADPRKLNTGGALLTKTLLAVSGATDAALTAAYRRHGDLARVEEIYQSQVDKPAEDTLNPAASSE